MAILRTDIERALNELLSQEGGMRFQSLAVVLGKKRWPELIACQRKKDLGLDAYASPSLTSDKVGKGLASSITATLKKISGDATTAKKNFPDLKALLFVTPSKVGNINRNRWTAEIQHSHGMELHIIEREEVITQMMMPENASLCAGILYLESDAGPWRSELIGKARRAAAQVAQTWARKTKGHPLIDLTAVQLSPDGAESEHLLSLGQIDQTLMESRRIVLEGAAGCGKTTTLIQLAQHEPTNGTRIIVELSSWTSSGRGILEYIAGMPAFQAEGLTAADLAVTAKSEPFLFLLNGWNEIAETNSANAGDALRALERDFPSAGIIVATRTHHVTPPLPGATRLRLLLLGRAQRTAYISARLGAPSAELRALIDADPSLDDLTRTPFILSEVVSLFEAGAEIPSMKIGVLAQVLRLHEQRDEHRNALQTAPIFSLQADYLKALATEMSRRGAVALSEADARAITAAVTKRLVDLGQAEPTGAHAILATLSAHHVLERVDYPQTAFQFEHQQLQEYYAALDVRAQLLDLQVYNRAATGRFTADYVNDPAWAESLRMIAETFCQQTGDDVTDQQNVRVGACLVKMALAVDPVFSGELAFLCGATVWNEVRTPVGERLRAIYSIGNGSFQQYAIAAMLATGSEDFSDIILPRLAGLNGQTRLGTYRAWRNIHLSSLGANWRECVRGWSEEARVDFVSELLHNRVDQDVAALAVEDDSTAVKKAAASGLMWTRSDDALTRVLESMDPQTFEMVARDNIDRIPPALISKAVVALRKFIENSTDQPRRLRTALDLIELGETSLESVVRDAMAALPSGDMHNLGPYYIRPALEFLQKTDPEWASTWVATQVAEGLEGLLYEREYWLRFASAIPKGIVERYLLRIETEDFKNRSFAGMIAVIITRADVNLAARVFTRIRELRGTVDTNPGQRELERQLIRQMEALFHAFPDNVCAEAILSSVSAGQPLDIKVATRLLSRVARSDMESLCISDDGLRGRLREYLKSSIDLALDQDDFSGEEKADLASSIAQVGLPADMPDLVRLIRADIERVRRGRTARAAGDHGPLGNGGGISFAHWNIVAVLQLDPIGAEQTLIDILPEPEYLSEAAAAMARLVVPDLEFLSGRMLRYDLVWDAREGKSASAYDRRRTRCATALNSEIERLREGVREGRPAAGVKDLAIALATVDGLGSVAVVAEVIADPGEWGQHSSLIAAERLLMAGVVLPSTSVFALADSMLERTKKGILDQDRYLLRRILALCPFVDDPTAGIVKMRDMLVKRPLRGYEVSELAIALGESRSDAAVDLLYELASDANTFEHCENNLINAIAALDTPHARELLLGFVDPDIRGIQLSRHPRRDDVIASRLAELAQRIPDVAARLWQLCKRDLPESNRDVLSNIMDWLGTPEALAANLNLIDDAKPAPVPGGTWHQIESAFVERRPTLENALVFSVHARESNELRIQLFRIALDDEKRRKSALMLLAQIEEWRLEYGRPTGELRHPDLSSGQPWPPC